RVAVRHGVDQDPDAANVVELIEVDALAPRLPPDAVDVLRTPRHLRAHAGGLERALELADDLGDVSLAIRALRGEPACDAVIVLGLEVPEREILELPLELPHAQPAREGREDLARLERD